MKGTANVHPLLGDCRQLQLFCEVSSNGGHFTSTVEQNADFIPPTLTITVWKYCISPEVLENPIMFGSASELLFSCSSDSESALPLGLSLEVLLDRQMMWECS